MITPISNKKNSYEKLKKKCICKKDEGNLRKNMMHVVNGLNIRIGCINKPRNFSNHLEWEAQGEFQERKLPMSLKLKSTKETLILLMSSLFNRPYHHSTMGAYSMIF